MPKNKSEQLAAQLFRRAFLRMYVSVNPQIEVAGNPSAFELCDVLISFHGLVILAEVKEFNEVIGQSAPEKWLRNRVFREARFQLTRGVKALTESSYRVFDMKTKATIDLGNVEAIMTAVVFFRNDVENYDYRRALPEEEGFRGVNIFSSVDFKLALEQIPTPLDFFRYLEKRYLALKTGEHLCPVVETPRGIHLLPIDGISDEKILIADYLYNHTKNHDGDTKAARALIRAAERMSDNWGGCRITSGDEPNRSRNRSVCGGHSGRPRRGG